MTTPPGDTPPHDPFAKQPEPQQSQQPDTWSGQPGYPQPGYPQPGQPQPGYPQQWGAPQGYAVPDHPKATTSMVLGILGLVVCGFVAPFAWSTGKKTVAEIDASGGRLGGRGQAQAGYILGIVGSVLLALGLVFLVIYFVIIIALIGGTAASS